MCSVVSDSFVTPQTVAHQAPLSMGFPRQEYWSGLPCPPPGDLPDPETEPVSPASPALAGGFITTEPPGKPKSSELLDLIKQSANISRMSANSRYGWLSQACAQKSETMPVRMFPPVMSPKYPWGHSIPEKLKIGLQIEYVTPPCLYM